MAARGLRSGRPLRPPSARLPSDPAGALCSFYFRSRAPSRHCAWSRQESLGTGLCACPSGRRLDCSRMWSRQRAEPEPGAVGRLADSLWKGRTLAELKVGQR